jgi:hypothetical protein
MPVLKKDKSVRVEFMAFGGGWVDQTLKKTMESTPHTGALSAHFFTCLVAVPLVLLNLIAVPALEWTSCQHDG